MLPADFKLRTDFPKGEQARVTQNILEACQQFRGLSYPDGFSNIHDYLFKRLTIVPYTDEVKEIERTRRWKLTADELLKVGTIVDTKYCNDVVNLFLSMAKGLGFDAKLAKVFSKDGEDDKIKVHSLAIVESPDLDERYLINIGSKDKYWIKPLPKDQELKFGAELPNNWFIWKVDLDQWSMGLNDSSQEHSTIVADANKFFNK